MIDIRSAGPDDCIAIHRVHVDAVLALYPQHHRDPGIDRWIATRSPEVYAKEMETDRFVVAEDDGRIVGFGALDIGKANVTSVFVDPRYARAGIGSRILAALEGIARRAGLASVGLQAAGNAVDFYKKAGYQAKTADAAQPEWAEMRKELS